VLGSGQTSAGTTTVVIPVGRARGGYFLIAVADADGAVTEADETNNARSRAFTVN
jgi:subtilase family serine protease